MPPSAHVCRLACVQRPWHIRRQAIRALIPTQRPSATWAAAVARDRSGFWPKDSLRSGLFFIDAPTNESRGGFELQLDVLPGPSEHLCFFEDGSERRGATTDFGARHVGQHLNADGPSDNISMRMAPRTTSQCGWPLGQHLNAEWRCLLPSDCGHRCSPLACSERFVKAVPCSASAFAANEDS